MGCSSSTAGDDAVTENPMVRKQREEEAALSFSATYTKQKQIGEGKYATVFLVKHKKTNMMYAAKCIPKSKLVDEEDVTALAQEIKIMKKMNHPNLVKLVDFYIENDTYYLVQELMTGGELFDAIVKREFYSEAEAKEFARTLADALAYCHRHNVVHRDLKPENILLSTNRDDAVLKVADFGFAKDVNEAGGALSTACGTPGYVAPEILEGQPYAAPVDCWSLGVIFYILLCGYPPFAEDTQRQLFEKIKRCEYEFEPEDWSHVSKGAIEFIRAILVADPKKRLTCEQMLKHPWLASKEAGHTNLVGTKAKLKSFNARRKLKAGMQTVRTAVRMKMMMAGLHAAKRKMQEDESKNQAD